MQNRISFNYQISIKMIDLFVILQKNEFKIGIETYKDLIKAIKEETNVLIKYPLNERLKNLFFSKFVMLKLSWKKLNGGVKRFAYKLRLTDKIMEFKIQEEDFIAICGTEQFRGENSSVEITNNLENLVPLLENNDFFRKRSSIQKRLIKKIKKSIAFNTNFLKKSGLALKMVELKLLNDSDSNRNYRLKITK